VRFVCGRDAQEKHQLNYNAGQPSEKLSTIEFGIFICCVPKCGPRIDFCPRARREQKSERENERDLQPTESNAKGITQKLTFNPLTLDDSNYCNSFLCLFINRTSSCRRRASSCPRYTECAHKTSCGSTNFATQRF
jgi:hypothetical protein